MTSYYFANTPKSEKIKTKFTWVIEEIELRFKKKEKFLLKSPNFSPSNYIKGIKPVWRLEIAKNLSKISKNPQYVVSCIDERGNYEYESESIKKSNQELKIEFSLSVLKLKKGIKKFKEPPKDKNKSCWFLSGRFKQLKTYLIDGTLTMQIEITVNSFPDNKMSQLPVHVADKSCSLEENLSELFESSQFCDVVFSIRGEEVVALRAILAQKSEVFKEMLSKSMKEVQAKVIEIKDFEPQVFKTLLKFIYTGNLKAAISSMETNKSSIPVDGEGSLQLTKKLDKLLHRGTRESSPICDQHFLIKLYKAAHYYKVESLKEICEKALIDCIDKFEPELIDFVKLYDVKQLKQILLRVMCTDESFIDTVLFKPNNSSP